MKLLRLIIVFIFSTNSIGAQTDRSSFSITYSLSRAGVTNHSSGNFEDNLSSSIFAHYEFGRRKILSYSIGFGFLQSHFTFRDYFGMQPYRDEERHYRVNYIVIPAGMKFFIGSFYFHPEVGISYNSSITTQSYLVDNDKKIIDKNFTSDRFTIPFKPLLSNSMTVGFEFKIQSIIVLSAIKGYLAFNPRFLDTYGLGLMVGLKI